MCITGVAVLIAFAPASHDLLVTTPAPAGEKVHVPLLASLAAFPATPDQDEEPAEVLIHREWDVPNATAPAIISWWDGDRWTEIEAEQEAWRSEWLREARRNPERIPADLWPSILEWAPDDRGLERSAQAVIRSDLGRRWASDPGEFRPSDRGGANMGERVRRWADDVLNQLRERTARRPVRRRRPGL
jgi:hypothetical protein